jgi:hypothetical protein
MYKLSLLRIFQFTPTLIEESLKDMAGFTVVLAIMHQGFLFGYMRSINYCWFWMEWSQYCHPDSVESEYDLVDTSYKGAWIFLFGDFSAI